MNLFLIVLMAFVVNPKIHHWEKALQDATASHVASVIPEAKKHGDSGELVTPRVEFKLGLDGYGPNTSAPHNWIHPSDKSRWPDTRDGKLYATIVTRRGAEGQDHYALVGTIRSKLQSCSALSGRMELHKVEKIFESGSSPEVRQGEHHDVTQLTFEVRMRILFGSGPAETTANPEIFTAVES